MHLSILDAGAIRTAQLYPLTLPRLTLRCLVAVRPTQPGRSTQQAQDTRQKGNVPCSKPLSPGAVCYPANASYLSHTHPSSW